MKWMKTLSLITGMIASPGGPVEAQGQEITVLFHGGVHGEIEDCGCKRNPLGGIAQRAAHLAKVRAESAPLVVVDAGNLFGKPTEEQRIQTGFLVHETAALDYTVLGVGAWDLNYGIDYLRAQGERLPFTSANLRVDGELLFPPYRISEHDGLTVGWVSVLDPDQKIAALVELTGVEIAPVDVTLDEVLPELRSRVDLLVLLGNLRQGELSRRLKASGNAWDLDLAIDGGSTYHYADAKEVNGTTLLAANDRGRYLGRLHLTASANGDWDQEYELIPIKARGRGPSDDAVAERVEEFLAAQQSLARARTGLREN